MSFVAVSFPSMTSCYQRSNFSSYIFFNLYDNYHVMLYYYFFCLQKGPQKRDIY